jgi:hypothetical protein
MKDDCEDTDDDSKASSEDQNDTKISLENDWDRPKLPIYKIDNTILPPLPLITFKGLGFRSNGVMTINGDEIKAIANNLSPNKRSGDCLQDLLHIRKLIMWFTARSHKEAVIRQHRSRYKAGLSQTDDILLREIPVYKNASFDGEKGPPSGIIQTPQLSESDLILNADAFVIEVRKSNLTFDSNFESGNLFKAVRVTGRENINVEDKLHHSEFEPGKVDQEYDLTLRNDLNTDGNIQWYYFSASTAINEKIFDDPPKKVVYPLKVRFNIVNMQKKDALYNYGMKPATFSSSNTRDDWRHRGEDICYFKQCQSSTEDIDNNDESRKKKRQNYVLTFTYTFLGPVTTYFAHMFPYTFSDLKRYLSSLEENDRILKIMTRKELCLTLAGNVCEVVTITSKCTEVGTKDLKPAIIISSRIHPGETNASYMIHGVIDFLVSEHPEAIVLRDTFVFQIVPMLNPDGVVHGNYRCSLIGTDLNRRYIYIYEYMYIFIYIYIYI